MKWRRGLRLSLCGAVLAAVGLATPAMAWNEPLWVRQLGSTQDDRAFGVATDAAGSVYLTGTTSGSLGGPNRGGSDAWVAKVDAAGRVVRKRQLGTEADDSASGVATDAAGNVYLTGTTSADAWVAKVDPAGCVVWKRQLKTETYDYASGVATDTAGNVVIVGVTGPNFWSAAGWIAKYNGDGHLLWKRGTSGIDFDGYFLGVATDGNGNIVIAAGSSAAKYDADGNLLWERYVGDGGGGAASAVATDGVGSVLVAGASEYSGSTSVAWVTKLDATGNEGWTRQLSANEQNVAYGVATDGSFDVFISGRTDGSLGGRDYGGYDAFVAKYSGD